MANQVSQKLESGFHNFKVELAPGRFFKLTLHCDDHVAYKERQELFEKTVNFLKKPCGAIPNSNLSRFSGWLKMGF